MTAENTSNFDKYPNVEQSSVDFFNELSLAAEVEDKELSAKIEELSSRSGKSPQEISAADPDISFALGEAVGRNSILRAVQARLMSMNVDTELREMLNDSPSPDNQVQGN